MNEIKNQYGSNKRNYPISVRFDIEEKELMDKVISRFKDIDRSRLIRLSVRKVCDLILYQGKLEISMEENGT